MDVVFHTTGAGPGRLSPLSPVLKGGREGGREGGRHGERVGFDMSN